MFDGRTAREHIRGHARRNPAEAAKLLADVVPGVPPAIAVVAVDAFETLSRMRQSSAMGAPEAISPQALVAYGPLFGIELTPRDARWVVDQDTEFLTVLAEVNTPARIDNG